MCAWYGCSRRHGLSARGIPNAPQRVRNSVSARAVSQMQQQRIVKERLERAKVDEKSAVPEYIELKGEISKLGSDTSEEREVIDDIISDEERHRIDLESVEKGLNLDRQNEGAGAITTSLGKGARD